MIGNSDISSSISLHGGGIDSPPIGESTNFSDRLDTNSVLVRLAAQLIVSAESNELTPEFARQQVTSMWAAVRPAA